MSYAVARLEEIEEIDDGRVPMRPIRHHLGISAFGANAFTAKNAGDRLINEHDEADAGDRNEELYVVVSGHARFEIGGETVDAPEGTLVFVQPEATRTAFAEEAGTTVLAVGATAGKAYEPVGWEIWAPLNRLYRAGDYEEAVRQGRELVEANSQYAVPLYNLACCESLAGLRQDAIEHLRVAFERSPSLRELAREDSDLDPIREEPGFRELVA